MTAATVNDSDTGGLSKTRSLCIYLVLLGVFAIAVLGVLHIGRLLEPTAGADAAVAHNKSAHHASDLSRLLLQVVVIVTFSRGMGWVSRMLRQPQVVGEMMAGIILGPSLLGWVFPEVAASLFPTHSLGVLGGISQIGLALFMFTVGLELDLPTLLKRPHAAVLTSHVSIVLPFLLGMILSLHLYSSMGGRGVPFVNFSLFMGIAMSITAFPVLARILSERKLLSTTVGTITIACAAVDDVTAWCILAGVIALARADGMNTPWNAIIGALAFCVVMLWVVRPALHAASKRYAHGEIGDNVLAIVCILVLASASITEWLGIHALFGAFFMGSIMPRNGRAVRQLLQKVSHVTVVLLLPIFFALTGLRTDVRILQGIDTWISLIAIIAVAIGGKLFGSSVAARISGLPWRDALSLGVLMNTRGLMELVALNIGYDAGIITKPLFTMMVCMALFTTVLTTPVLDLIGARHTTPPNT